MNGLIFVVEETPECGYTARALGPPIFTKAETLDDRPGQVRDAVRCHFDERQAPKAIRRHGGGEEKSLRDEAALKSLRPSSCPRAEGAGMSGNQTHWEPSPSHHSGARGHPITNPQHGSLRMGGLASRLANPAKHLDISRDDRVSTPFHREQPMAVCIFW
mgnify:CR=1 FL=1